MVCSDLMLEAILIETDSHCDELVLDEDGRELFVETETSAKESCFEGVRLNSVVVCRDV